ncbi:MAG: MBL fold metallo-hydrolase [Lachnospiraceae bacterium]|nr:MBL fold metallo-hydrolase [Lachnospiraceae bacterium]
MRKKRTILNILLLIPVMVAFSACAGKETPPETPSFISSEIPSESIAESEKESDPVPEAESIPLPDETVTASPTLLYQGHGSLRIQTADDKVIYVDPYAGEGYDLPADVILITHGHFDHTQTDLIKTKEEDCRTITWKEALADGEYQNFDFEFVSVQAVEAGYNKNHNVNECAGYVLTFPNDVKVYISGDTSKTPQMEKLKDIDYAFFCCDGVYNMDPAEAGECASLVGAVHSIPYHMKPADPKDCFDQAKADAFEAEGKIILKPGDELLLEKDR